MLITKLVNIDVALDSAGGTALHLAVASGKEETVIKLLQKGADPNKMNNAGHTPIHVAILSRKGHQLLRVLIQYGGDINKMTQSGMSPIHLTLLSKHPRVSLYFVLQCEPSLEITNEEGQTPLWYFVNLPQSPIHEIGMLLDYGCNPNVKDSSGQNLLHVIASEKSGKESIKLAQYLIESGIDINAQTLYEDATPVHHAVLKNNCEMVSLLLNNNANLLLRDSYGLTPYLVAAYHKLMDPLVLILNFVMLKGVPENNSPKKNPVIICHCPSIHMFEDIVVNKLRLEINELKNTKFEYPRSLSIYDVLFMENIELAELLKNVNFQQSLLSVQDHYHFMKMYRKLYINKIQTAVKLLLAKEEVLEFFTDNLTNITETSTHKVVSNMDENSLMKFQRRVQNFKICEQFDGSVDGYAKNEKNLKMSLHETISRNLLFVPTEFCI